MSFFSLLSNTRLGMAAFLCLTPLVVGSAPAFGMQPLAAPEAPPKAAAEPAGLIVPSLPADASHEELLAFVEGLLPPKQQPRSREEMLDYIRGAARLAVEAADRVLDQAKADEEIYAKAAKLKLESLGGLGQLGEEGAADAMAAFAATLAKSPVKALAVEGKRMLIVGEAQKMFSSRDFSSAPTVIQQTAELLAADPDDLQTAGLAMQLTGAMEQIPGGEEMAAAAMTTFGELFKKSDNERIQMLSKSFEGKLRLLSLPGKPMEIKGTLLGGEVFDPAMLAGKVVLVDFWATWCGPCVAEMPNIIEQYKKYHEKGFEVVGISLDEDKAEVEEFIADNEIPWTILFAGKGWQDPVAEFYGISGIPQLVLIGRDGNVITLDVRGEKLGEMLAKLFKDAG